MTIEEGNKRDEERRVRSMLAMRPTADVAMRVAKEIDPIEAAYWSDRKLGAIERAIFNARQEGYDAALADMRAGRAKEQP